MVTLHGPGAAVACVGEREWTFLRAADGTRDLEGIRLAAEAEGRVASRDQLSAFFGELAEQGMLCVGSPPQEGYAKTAEAPRRAIPLPGFELSCDGAGTCCRLYPTTVFLPLDVANARSACPSVMDGGHHADRAFTPLHSSAAPPWSARAVAMVNGRCAYLGADNRCQIHVHGGPELKPAGCQSYPLLVVDDGAELRIGPRPECRCVWTSPPSPTPDGVAIPVGRIVEVVPDPVPVSRDTTWSRARYRAWAKSVAPRVDGSDAIAILWQLAHELSPSAASVVDHARLWVTLLAAHNARQRWRSTGDLARRIPLWMERALSKTALVETGRGAPDATPLEGEHLYLRAVAFGHGWVLGNLPLVDDLRERAVRIYMARRLTAARLELEPSDPDPGLTEPIALVEAVCRGFGITLCGTEREAWASGSQPGGPNQR
jgi:lysine-N-methylase